MTASGAEVYVCVVCAVAETRQNLLSTCDECGNLYHLNPINGLSKDCGQAAVEDEEVGIQFFCFACMDRGRQEDRDRIERLKDLVNAGSATPDTVALLMQSIGGIIGGAVPPAEVAPGASASCADASRSDAPSSPPLCARRGASRRYRRIE